MMPKRCLVPLALVAGLLCSTVAAAQPPVQYPGNGHYYEMIANVDMTWDMARDDAAGRTFNDWPGHLVTITDAAEEAFLIANFPEISQSVTIFLGGTDSDSEGDWTWITGEPWEYTNWGPGEPNDDGGEDCLEYSAEPTPVWNDIPCSLVGAFWIVEYEAAPVPSTPWWGLVLIALSLLWVSGWIWRRKRA